jgi:hypothetical protein
MSTTVWIQILGVIFGISMLYFTFLKFKRKELNAGEFWTWMSLWVVLGFIAVFPSTLDIVIEPLNFYRRLDFFVVVGFFVLLAMAFHNYTLVKRTHKKVEHLVREFAMQNSRDRDDVNNGKK